MKIVNPVLKGFNPDPSICRVGEDYYMAVSTFEWFPGVQIYHSKDLANWRLASQPLNEISQLDMLGNPDSGGVWAPCLSYADGKFWLIYSDMKVVEGDVFKDGHNYLTTCTSIDGQWTEPIYMNSSGFDPSLFHDEDGKKYFVNMVWDYRPHNHRFYGIVMQEYSISEKKLVGEKQLIFKGTDIGLTEAPHLYKIGNYYYLIVAEGGTKYEHAVTVARSTKVEGLYEVHPDNPILSSWDEPRLELQKAGHASLVETSTGEWYLPHLTGRPIKLPGQSVLENRGYCPLGRETAIQKIEWKNEWPYVVGGPHPSVEVEGPQLAEHRWDMDNNTDDDFNKAVLNPQFQTLRIPFSDKIGSLTKRPGFLRLYGGESLHSTFTQALVARRWQSLNFEAETYLEFEPETFQQFAGLVCYYNIRNWVSFHVTHHEEKGKIIDILACDKFTVEMPIHGNEIVVPADTKGVFLKVKVSELTYLFSYSFDGKDWHDVPLTFDTYKLSDDYIDQGGFFTGAFVGVNAVDITGERKVADFDYFKYTEK